MDALWEGLCSGTSALSRIESFDASGFPAKLGGDAPGVRARDRVPKSYRKAVKVMARDTEIAVVAASLAVEDAALVTRVAQNGPTTYPGERLGCHIGAGLISAETQGRTQALVTSRASGGPARVDGPACGVSGLADLPPVCSR